MSGDTLTCSVVVPVLDDAAEPRGPLAALAGQTERALEVIVVDNGGRDSGAEAARAAGHRRRRATPGHRRGRRDRLRPRPG